MKTIKFLIPVLGFIVLVNACKKDDQPSSSGMTPLSVRMTDAPGDYEEVNVDIKEVRVHSDNGGWITLNTKAGVYNLLKLTNGLDTLLGTAVVPSGNISQIRLILGSANTVKVDGVLYPLATPSAEQSGLKLQVHETLVDSVAYTILLDFDAGRSIHQTGTGAYKLKPVLRTITQLSKGAIKGSVTPAESHPSVLAILGTDTVGTFADTSGNFFIKGLSAGSYKVLFLPATPYKDTIFSGISVSMGTVTQMSPVTLIQ